MAEQFDPIAALQALDRQRVAYVVVGGLGRVIHGSDELTDGLDIVPSLREENLRRLGLALDELDARRSDGKRLALERDLDQLPVLELRDRRGRGEARSGAGRHREATTTCAALRGASRSDTASALRSPPSATRRACSPPSTANRTSQALRTLRRLIELEQSISRGIDLAL